MRSYVLKKVTSAPDWDTIDALPIDNLQWTNPPVDIRAQGQLCWDEAAIYVRLRAWETEIRAEHSGLLQSVCEDSCLEFFFRPTDDLRYFNMEFNLNCALYLGFGPNMPELTRLAVQDEAEIFRPHAQRTEDGWEIFYRVPFFLVRRFFPDFRPEIGLAMYGNCYKCGDKTVKPHFLSWNPIRSIEPQFHCPQDFGRLILGD